jgi:hypothetical protein
MLLRGSPGPRLTVVFNVGLIPERVFALDLAQIAFSALASRSIDRRKATMSIALQDPTLPRDPSAPHGFSEIDQEAELRAPRTLADELLAELHGGAAASETSCEPASSGPVR